MLSFARTIGCSALILAGAACSEVNAVDPAANGRNTLENGAAARTRIVEIDRALSVPLTGTPEDADRRATLRAERAALTGGSHAPLPRVAAGAPAYRDQLQTRNTAIVVAHDSHGDHQPGRMSKLEAMTPTERQRYYHELAVKNGAVLYVNPKAPY